MNNNVIVDLNVINCDMCDLPYCVKPHPCKKCKILKIKLNSIYGKFGKKEVI